MNKLKRYFAVFMTLMFLTDVHVGAAVREPTGVFYVNDFANVLSAGTIDQVVSINEQLAYTGAQIVVVTVDFTDGMSAYDYAFNLFNAWGVGDAERNNGFLLLLSIVEEDYAISLGAGAENIIPSGSAQVLLDEFLEDDFDNGDYDAGVLKTVEEISSIVFNYYGTETENTGAQQSNNADSSGLLTNDLTALNAKYVNDDAGVLSSRTISDLTSRNERLWEMNGGQIAVVTVNNTGNTAVDEYAVNLFNTLGVGDADRNNGVLMLLSIDDGEYSFALGDGLAAQVRESELASIVDQNFTAPFNRGNYDKAVLNTFNALYDLIVDIYGDDTAGGFYAGAVPGGNLQSGNSFSQSMDSFFSTVFSLVVFSCIVILIVSLFSRPRHVVPGMPRRRFIFIPWPRRRYFRPFWGPRRGPAPPRPPANNPGPRPAPPRSKPSGGSIFGGGSSSTGFGSGGKSTPNSTGASRGAGASRGSSGFGGASRSGGGISRGGGGMSRGGGGMSRGGGAGRGGKR